MVHPPHREKNHQLQTFRSVCPPWRMAAFGPRIWATWCRRQEFPSGQPGIVLRRGRVLITSSVSISTYLLPVWKEFAKSNWHRITSSKLWRCLYVVRKGQCSKDFMMQTLRSAQVYRNYAAIWSIEQQTWQYPPECQWDCNDPIQGIHSGWEAEVGTNHFD